MYLLKSKTRALFVVFAFLSIFATCGVAFAAFSEYVEGEAIVLLKNPNAALTEADIANPELPKVRNPGVKLPRAAPKMTKSDIVSPAMKSYVSGAAGRANAVAVSTYETLSVETNTILVHIKSNFLTTEKLITRLNEDPNVISASPNYIYRINRVPNDPMYNHSVLWGLRAINMPAAWDNETGSASKYVAVLDTGILATHDDLKDNVDTSLSKDFTGKGAYTDGHGHGTHVSGTIGAKGNNGVGLVGVNWHTRIIAVKVLNDAGESTSDTIMNGLDYVLTLINSGVDVAAVNFSMNSWQTTTPEEYRQGVGYYAAFKALAAKTVIVVAAGNEGLPVGVGVGVATLEKVLGSPPHTLGTFGTYYYCYPASFIDVPNMIVVGATNSSNAAAHFTNWSDKYVDILAPGVGIWSTYANNNSSYETASGTSMAAPHVASAIALLASANPSWGPGELKEALLSSANGGVNPTAGPLYKPMLGDYTRPISKHGLLDVGKAVDKSIYPMETTNGGDGGGGGCSSVASGWMGFAQMSLLALSALFIPISSPRVKKSLFHEHKTTEQVHAQTAANRKK